MGGLTIPDRQATEKKGKKKGGGGQRPGLKFHYFPTSLVSRLLGSREKKKGSFVGSEGLGAVKVRHLEEKRTGMESVHPQRRQSVTAPRT